MTPCRRARPARGRDSATSATGTTLQRARCRLGQRAAERRAVAASHDQPGRAEHCGRAQDGADVVRVGDLVEHDERATPVGAVIGNGLPAPARAAARSRAARPGARCRRRAAVEVARADALVAQCRAALSAAAEAVGGVVGEPERTMAAVGIGESRLDGMDAAQQRAGSSSASGAGRSGLWRGRLDCRCRGASLDVARPLRIVELRTLLPARHPAASLSLRAVRLACFSLTGNGQCQDKARSALLATAGRFRLAAVATAGWRGARVVKGDGL